MVDGREWLCVQAHTPSLPPKSCVLSITSDCECAAARVVCVVVVCAVCLHPCKPEREREHTVTRLLRRLTSSTGCGDCCGDDWTHTGRRSACLVLVFCVLLRWFKLPALCCCCNIILN